MVLRKGAGAEINSAITRCRALNLNDVEAELVALARNLNRITASLQPAIFVEMGALNDPAA